MKFTTDKKAPFFEDMSWMLSIPAPDPQGLGLEEGLYNQALRIKSMISDYDATWKHYNIWNFADPDNSKQHDLKDERLMRRALPQRYPAYLVSREFEKEALTEYLAAYPESMKWIADHLKSLDAPSELLNKWQHMLPCEGRVHGHSLAGSLSNMLMNRIQDEGFAPIIFKGLENAEKVRSLSSDDRLQLREEMFHNIWQQDTRGWCAVYPVKIKEFLLPECKFPVLVSYPDCKMILEKHIKTFEQVSVNSPDEAISSKAIGMVLDHMELLEQYRPMLLIELALEQKLVSYMLHLGAVISKAWDRYQKKNCCKDIEIEGMIRRDYVDIPEMFSEDKPDESVELSFVKQLYVIEGKDYRFHYGMDDLKKLPAMAQDPQGQAQWEKTVMNNCYLYSHDDQGTALPIQTNHMVRLLSNLQKYGIPQPPEKTAWPMMCYYGSPFIVVTDIETGKTRELISNFHMVSED